jgi:hypothetical protein
MSDRAAEIATLGDPYLLHDRKNQCQAFLPNIAVTQAADGRNQTCARLEQSLIIG